SEAEMGGNMETTLSHWADACHAQGGTVVIPHFPCPNGEPAALVATGRTDAVEMISHGHFFHQEYYRYLNAGYRLPLVGGTDKMESSVPIGLYRTYAYLPPDQELTYENWCAALKTGNTFLSGGPLLSFAVEGQPLGSTVKLPSGGGTVEVEAMAESVLPIHTLQIVQQGKVVAQTEDARGTRKLHLKTRLRVTGDTWFAARCGGPAYEAIPHFDSWRRGVMGHTSPIYLACGGDYQLMDPEVVSYMLTLVHGGLEYIRQRSAQTPEERITHHHSEADHQAFLERPFHEASAALHQRLHAAGINH
ncbi:MAG TPA: CehA/McbA family metallohydrolase, partial [Armatimonadota bacterium]